MRSLVGKSLNPQHHSQGSIVGKLENFTRFAEPTFIGNHRINVCLGGVDLVSNNAAKYR